MAAIVDNFLLLVLALLVLSLSFTNHVSVEVERTLSEEEDLELERQLKILNKPAIKTIHTGWGDIFDCIDIHKQPAFDHPLLKNHKIQMEPSSVPKRVREETSSTTTKQKSLSFITPVDGCPKGAVPIRRTRKQDLIRALSLSSNRITLNTPNSRNHYRAGLVYRNRVGENFYGARAFINVYNPKVKSYQYSSALIGLESGPEDRFNTIRFGWMVFPELYGDYLTRSFTDWTIDGYQKTGCWNTLCPGFVQVNERITPGSPFANVSTYQGPQFEVDSMVHQDPKTGNWWLEYGENQRIGYWPKSLFNLMGEGGAELIYWGGYARAGYFGFSPPMGSGHLPDGHYGHACSIAEIQYLTKDFQKVDPKVGKFDFPIDCKQFYGLGFYADRKGSFYFGGPGGKC